MPVARDHSPPEALQLKHRFGAESEASTEPVPAALLGPELRVRHGAPQPALGLVLPDPATPRARGQRTPSREYKPRAPTTVKKGYKFLKLSICNDTRCNTKAET